MTDDVEGSMAASGGPFRLSKLWVRIIVSIAAGAWGATLVLTLGAHTYDSLVHKAKDFDQFWFAAGALRDGLNPYAAVGPGLAFKWPWPLYYPLPATLLALPFSYIPVLPARAVFFGLSSALLAFGLTRESYHRLVVFASASYLVASNVVQWEVLLTAAALLPVLGFVFAAKPNIALALLFAYPRRRAIVGVAIITVLSLVVMPSWPVQWLNLIRTASDKAPPVSYAGGFLLLLALLRWRRPEARLIVALACTPLTMMPYVTIPLFLIPASLMESLVLAWATWVAWFTVGLMGPHANFAEFNLHNATVFVPLVYLPALIMVLRRPNEGELPNWLIKRASALLPGNSLIRPVNRGGTSRAE